MTAMGWILAVCSVIGAWWVVVIVVDGLVDRRVRVPERLVVRVLPGRLPFYVHQDFRRARAARRGRGVPRTPPQEDS